MQDFLDSLTQHPVLSRSTCLQQFLEDGDQVHLNNINIKIWENLGRYSLITK